MKAENPYLAALRILISFQAFAQANFHYFLGLCRKKMGVMERLSGTALFRQQIRDCNPEKEIWKSREKSLNERNTTTIIVPPFGCISETMIF